MSPALGPEVRPFLHSFPECPPETCSLAYIFPLERLQVGTHHFSPFQRHVGAWSLSSISLKFMEARSPAGC